jgi:membrane protease YdiL (CAAX protease family)
LLIVASAVVAGLALVAWFALVHPDYSATRAALFPSVPTPLLLLGVVLFSAVNGALEEVAYRGVLLDALDAALGAGVAPVVIQALAFGALHIGGFPRGAAGVVLAAIFGLMMGTVRRQTRGLLAPWLAHILADVTIGAILIATR